MNNKITITFEDLFQLIVGLIEDDLRIQKHFYHLSLSGLDTGPLQLNLYKRVFILVGYKQTEISEELEDWYFEQTNRVNDIDLLHDEATIYDLSIEILEGLLKMRNGLYIGRKT